MANVVYLSEADRTNLVRLAATEVDHALARSNPAEYERQMQGVIDTVLNRLASDEFPDGLDAVANQRNAFSAINGPRGRGHTVYGSISSVPSSVVPRGFDPMVREWLREREQGAPSSVGGNLQYANPFFADESNRPWIEELDGPQVGSGLRMHYHGTTTGFTPVEAVLAPGSGNVAPVPLLRPQSFGNSAMEPTPQEWPAALPRATAGTPATNYNTPLTPAQERQFQAWKRENAPDDSGQDYDLRGAFLSGVTPSGNGHMPDTFKKPNHPTFSVESQYAPYSPQTAGRWDGDRYVPAPARLIGTPQSYAGQERAMPGNPPDMVGESIARATTAEDAELEAALLGWSGASQRPHFGPMGTPDVDQLYAGILPQPRGNGAPIPASVEDRVTARNRAQVAPSTAGLQAIYAQGGPTRPPVNQAPEPASVEDRVTARNTAAVSPTLVAALGQPPATRVVRTTPVRGTVPGGSYAGQEGSPAATRPTTVRSGQTTVLPTLDQITQPRGYNTAKTEERLPATQWATAEAPALGGVDPILSGVARPVRRPANHVPSALPSPISGNALGLSGNRPAATAPAMDPVGSMPTQQQFRTLMRPVTVQNPAYTQALRPSSVPAGMATNMGSRDSVAQRAAGQRMAQNMPPRWITRMQAVQVPVVQSPRRQQPPLQVVQGAGRQQQPGGNSGSGGVGTMSIPGFTNNGSGQLTSNSTGGVYYERHLN